MLDITQLLTSVATNAMGVRGKSSQRALSFLGGQRSFLNASTLIGLTGIAVGAYQIFKDKSASSAPVARPVVPGTTIVGGSGQSLDTFGSSTANVVVPPIPTLPIPAHEVGDLPLRAVRIMIAAARCDGGIGEEEIGELILHAREAGLENQMRAEWQSPRPIAEICNGVIEPAHKRDLYVLAYTVLRADDYVSAPERAFLTQLASELSITPDMAVSIERETAHKIDQHG